MLYYDTLAYDEISIALSYANTELGNASEPAAPVKSEKKAEKKAAKESKKVCS